MQQNQTESLLEVLGKRQDVLDQVSKLEVSLVPAKRRWTNKGLTLNIVAHASPSGYHIRTGSGRGSVVAMKTLVLHDYLTQRGGAERVALLMAQEFGGGAITTSSFRPDGTFPEFGSVDVHEILPVVPARTSSTRLAMAQV